MEEGGYREEEQTCQSFATEEASIMKCNKGASSCTTGKKFFALSVMQGRHWFPRAAGDSPSLEIFKISLEKALSNLL